MQINRLFEIVSLLLDQKMMTAKELAKRFEVSQRTIYRDIDTLTEAGIPIYTTKGKGGGIGLLEEFELNESIFSKEEQNNIISALQGLEATKYPEAECVLAKLTNIFGVANPNWVSIDFSDGTPQSKNRMELLKKAIMEKRVIQFEYYNAQGKKSSREAEPIRLLFKDKAWYLLSYCRKRQELRIFKYTRMENIILLDEVFERSYEEIPDQEMAASGDKKMITFRLRIDASMASRVYDDFSSSEIKRTATGDFEIEVMMTKEDSIYAYLLSFGCNLEVLEPYEVRNDMKERLKKALRLYQ